MEGYFKDLLGGMEGRVVCGRRKEIGGEGREEVEIAIRRLRVGEGGRGRRSERGGLEVCWRRGEKDSIEDM